MMFTLPIITFYVCFYYVFAHKAEPNAWAGGAAILVTNLVIIWYVVSAFSEEDDSLTPGSEGDADGPRVGAFKRRTD